MYCLQSISKKGHHREISRRVDQSDYFRVFDSMLASELEAIGTIATGGGDAVQDDTNDDNDELDGGLSALVADLRRTCTSTSYTYLQLSNYY